MPSAPVRVPSQRLASSIAPVTSVAKDKGDNEMILGAVHRSPGICLIAEENPRKPQLGAVRPGIALNGVPFLQMRSVGSQRTSGREKEGNKEMAGFYMGRKQSFDLGKCYSNCNSKLTSAF